MAPVYSGLISTLLLSALASAQTGGGFGVMDYIDGDTKNVGFGRTVSAAGDVNGDGFPDFMIGAPSAAPNGVTGSGIAYLYSGRTRKLHYQINGVFPNQGMGSVMAAAGDVNGDGYDDVVLGTPKSTVNGLKSAGRVYVYSGKNGRLLWLFQGSGTGHRLGNSVSTAGDINGDGYADIIAGSHTLYAHVYSGADGSLLHKLTGQYWHHAHQVAGGGDVNGDGFDDVAVSHSTGESDSAGRPDGVAYVFSGADGSQLYRFTDNTTSDESFGASLDFAVGSSYSWSNYPGIVEMYSGRTAQKLSRLSPPGDPGLGYSMDYLGDLNGDGHPNCIVAMPARRETKVYGSAAILGLGPGLTLNHERVSIFDGGSVGMRLDFPAQAKNMEYKILMSAHGTGPTHHGIDIPLTLDAVMQRSANGIYPVNDHVGMHGALDHNASARARMSFPPDIPASMLGTQLWVAAVAHPAGELPQFASVARTITLVLY